MEDPPIASSVLTGPGAEALLTTVLAAEGARLVSWQLHSVDRRPGDRVTVGYDIVVRPADGPAADHEAREYLLATTLRVPATGATGVVTVRGAAGAATWWRHPLDPFLPALAAACSPRGVVSRLPRGSAPVELSQVVTYRPSRRAVLRVTAGDARFYLKVVRPDRVAALVARHELARGGAVVGPRVLGAYDDGLVVLAELPGSSLAQLLADGRGAEVDPGQVIDALLALPAGACELPARLSVCDRVPELAAAAGWVDAGRADAVGAEHLGRRVSASLAASDPGPVVATHGDLNVANLLFDTSSARLRLAGLLDLDTLGPGFLVDDVACLVGHLAVLPHLDPAAYARSAPRMLARCLEVFDRVVDPQALRARAAAVVLSLVPGAADRAQGRAWLRVGHDLLDGREPLEAGEPVPCGA